MNRGGLIVQVNTQVRFILSHDRQNIFRNKVIVLINQNIHFYKNAKQYEGLFIFIMMTKYVNEISNVLTFNKSNHTQHS